MTRFYPFLHSLIRPFSPSRWRNYRGILSLTYRWDREDQAQKQLHKSARLRKQMLELVASQKKDRIRERIQFLSDNFFKSFPS